ncbi:hypothetical protein RHGRI_016645 [Rhododendron griersonianum]|uniref:DNA mismatch repair protein MSH5 n=1 Tax=Rhododendron griersonianum TaxID=479676 RepID=A0AAV6JUY6_9ERIC|nr:hypothetical protein RHGRI_016645 [Rhododendron griersonianum]
MNSLSSLHGGTGLRVAELDVLISLAIACNYYEDPHAGMLSWLPYPDEVPCLSAKSLGHPVIRSDSLGKSTFVPNDVTIGGSGHASFILLILTGPNMGGKSTLLHQVCWAVISDQERMSQQKALKCHLLTGSLLDGCKRSYYGWPKLISDRASGDSICVLCPNGLCGIIKNHFRPFYVETASLFWTILEIAIKKETVGLVTIEECVEKVAF